MRAQRESAGKFNYRGALFALLAILVVAGALVIPRIVYESACRSGLWSASAYEAENADGKGVEKASAGEGFSGSGYVTGFDQQSDSLSFTLTAPGTAICDLTIVYAAPHGDKTATLLVNGKQIREVQLSESQPFRKTDAGKIKLAKGDNSVTILNNWGWYDIDRIELRPAGKNASRVPTSRPIANPVNPEASEAAKALLDYLVAQQGKTTLSGQQEYDNLTWIEERTGKLPAIVGFDLMDYSLSRVARGATSDEAEQAIAWHKRGGIVTISWHWNAPDKLLDLNEKGKEWWSGFYTAATTFDIAYAMDHPDSGEYQLLLDDIDAAAVQLAKLRDAGVPVLFRPLHEAEGGWFWWGAKGPEPALKLYRLLYERLTDVHRLDNLIWVWNSVSPKWYPGDDLVDIVSYDSYPQAGDYGSAEDAYDKLMSLTGGRKLAAMSENGPIPDPDALLEDEAVWSWFSTWHGDFLTDGITNEAEHLRRVYNHERVVTLDELPADLFSR